MGSTNILWHWQTTSMSGESFSPPDSDLMVARYGDIAESEHKVLSEPEQWNEYISLLPHVSRMR